jgi:CheY-like chemotaxis protein/anti-sigma regulatory factor (Ser/Thr protein kinase)
VLDAQVRAGLEQAIRSRDGILGIVAHDLRNPLNVISAAANSLHQRLPDSLTRRPVERIMRAAQRAEHLIRDLLDITAIEGGHFAIDKQRMDTTNMLLAAIESQQGLAASASVILASDLSPALPQVEADEERILELLENLVGNAVKFTMAGGTVTIGAAARDDDLLVWVKDNGPGIAPEMLPHLFDRFWQASKRDRRGAGLGLTICRAIVEAHGGRIWAESTLGVGTTVFFTIPTGRLSRKPEVTSVANILLVDDRPENLLSLKAILERPDYRLVTARSGEEALSLALRQPFAVALIDVAMPGMDGLEVAIHMKELERSRDIPIIFITAFGDDPQEIHRAYSAGGADYLVKPLDTEIVRKKVAVFVDLSRRRNETARLGKAKAQE